LTGRCGQLSDSPGWAAAIAAMATNAPTNRRTDTMLLLANARLRVAIYRALKSKSSSWPGFCHGPKDRLGKSARSPAQVAGSARLLQRRPARQHGEGSGPSRLLATCGIGSHRRTRT